MRLEAKRAKLGHIFILEDNLHSDSSMSSSEFIPDRISTNTPGQQYLSTFLKESAARHQHLCPRQVLGVRLALGGLRSLGLVGWDYQPRFKNENKRLLTIVETDGCAADGISVTTGCAIGKRTLRIVDQGKVAATLIDTYSNSVIRVSPTAASRTLAKVYAPQARSIWHAYLEAYQIIPDEELMKFEKVQLTRPLAEILSKPDARVICSKCGEEIINEREVMHSGAILCLHCAGDSYYQPDSSSLDGDRF
jgi:formylmethanofuran dehydrogenase subunit E